ncbi:hypothetical protein SEA_BEUFFERT_230 [Streptomyces phage Beuffert]|nr:hypothetical protein SEA_BEUFFERT_230 [Streptomyces phage Beuffert]
MNPSHKVFAVAAVIIIFILAVCYESIEKDKIVERQYNTCIKAGKNWESGNCK